MSKAFLYFLIIFGTIFMSENADARTKRHHSRKSVARVAKPIVRTTDDLLADQVRINREKLRLDSVASLKDNSYEEDDLYPALDLYDNNWNTSVVHPLKGKQMYRPDSLVIDVSGFYMPTMGDVTSEYGYRKRFHRNHYGTDLKIQIGDPIHAAFDGRVRVVARQRGYGNVIVIRHNNGLETVYGHLSKHLVIVDQYVKAGDIIALGGNTGRSTGPHLHFETRFLGTPINPEEIFDFTNKVTHMDSYVYYENANKHKSNKALESVVGIAYHKVKSGDTLFSIAEKYGTKISVLKKINKLRKSKLQVGQVIRTA
ncbi:MAG: peptidoglycan DD-metalloendopeptidase family protein [Bacteroidales bacterium]|nr:peptidoglycan DD-metalloendopeptidase family protein [Bacteroidales bacterium]